MGAAARPGRPAVRRLAGRRGTGPDARRDAVAHEHLTKDTTQTQIGIAYPSVPIGHPDYYAAQGAVNVLSGGMSSRLFTEVREKRGLCYSVWASYQTFKDRASVLCYAGTTNERAQETLDVMLGELRRLQDGIEAEEVERVQAGLKSSLIMQQESTNVAGRGAGVGLVLPRPRAQLRRDSDGDRRADAGEHRRPSEALSAGRVHDRDAGAAAVEAERVIPFSRDAQRSAGSIRARCTSRLNEGDPLRNSRD